MKKQHHKKTFASSVTNMTTGLKVLELKFYDSGGGDSGMEGQEIDSANENEMETLLREPMKLRVVVLENMRRREKAFNAILGFSGLKWQSLQDG